jgi:DNA polymerase III alpha subunit (gram-positive type)
MKITRLLKKKGLLDVDKVRLGVIVEALNIKLTGDLHDALVDIKATGNCLYKLLKRIKNYKEMGIHSDVVKKFEDWLILLEEPELTTK